MPNTKSYTKMQSRTTKPTCYQTCDVSAIGAPNVGKASSDNLIKGIEPKKNMPEESQKGLIIMIRTLSARSSLHTILHRYNSWRRQLFLRTNIV